MEKLHIDANKYTPMIDLDPEKGVLEIRGKSYPENTFEFYEQVMEWVKNYFKNPKEPTIVNMEIIYFNSSSSKWFFDFFDFLEEQVKKGHKVIVNWIYDEENDVAEEAGEDFQEDFEDLDINLVVKEEN